MPSKISTIVTYMIPTKDLHKNIRLKRLRLCQGWTTKIIYLKIKKIKAFIPSDKNIETQIEDFEKGGRDMFKEEICDRWDTMLECYVGRYHYQNCQKCQWKLCIGILCRGKPWRPRTREFWVKVNHDPNIRYLSNKTNSINQNMKSTTAIIVGLIQYEPPVIDDTTQEEITAGKHVVKLEDISLVSTNRNNTNGQSLNLPWMNAQSTGERSRTST
ncbi:hypothetical protein RhiirA1_467511 [Rhizophagus irregularis]|uniref:Uncharacterized protein n=1 Tax=Rhizophagus irregularis TaxID=588596 RepID=A0A2N0RBY3_9GLOM|nr:hypothetical protein RhiirA1_467511 [Rhizophagus irregularis]